VTPFALLSVAAGMIMIWLGGGLGLLFGIVYLLLELDLLWFAARLRWLRRHARG
jgi:hypothetical protein